MAARVIRRISLTRASIVVFVVVALLTTLFMVRMTEGEATTAPPDPAKHPHYFGPWPNWALSPSTDASATVTIVGDGSGATATAAVGGNGAITGITVTAPGSHYTSATVVIGGAGNGASATASVTLSGVVTAVSVDASGAGYTAPVATVSGGGATTDAAATAYGGVDAVALTGGGSGYSFPTVDFDWPDDPNGTVAKAHAEFDAATGEITAIVVDDPGSGYATAPGVVIRDGTLMDPIRNDPGTGAAATTTLKVLSVALDSFGAGYTSAPTVTISDAVGTGSGATASATVDVGGVSAVTVTAPGSGYVTPGGIQKFTDPLPGLCDPGVPGDCPADWATTVADTPVPANPISSLTKAIPLAVPVEKTYADPRPSHNGNPIGADEYEIAVIQYRSQFSSSMPEGALVRGYVQLETPEFVTAHPGVSLHYPLTNELLDGTKVPIMKSGGGGQWYGVTPPQWLGPVISATKNRPVRIVFHDLLPTGVDGDLFLPTDTTLMGSGMGPMQNPPAVTDDGTVTDGVRNPVCTETPQDASCFKQNRATLHLHGGITPWISDGTPHQWITPANEVTEWPQGVSVEDVPDMTPKNVADDGIQTFYYTNQQSARLLFYHDHAWGITRLNVYAGEAAGYVIGDDTEKSLLPATSANPGGRGLIPGPADTIPLVVQDRTFVPQDQQIYDVDVNGKTPMDPGYDANQIASYGQDPTWDKTRWGGYGNLWYHHVYMPAQNPGSASGLSAYGRWMYGPWFWPPASNTPHGPIDNPYYDPNCKVDDPATWQYQTDPFCEPRQIPGTPNVSVGMEQFNDTPVVNGVAYPAVTLDPKTYRFRILNAANDRFFNFQWYIADPSTGTLSEVALDPQLLAAAQTDPNVYPTPVQGPATAGPDWIQIGTEGGFLPAPAVIDGQQPITWITDPTRFDVGNGDKHSLLLAPAERADVIVDFSKFAGKTLILYNDAPAAYPARVASYDYYTGAPDLSPVGAGTILPGYGPNTRTVMQVTIANTAAAPAFNLTALKSAFKHRADGSGVFESGQHPIIVGQAAYNSAYATGFAADANCNPVPNDPNPAFQVCDGFVRIADTATFGFNTLKSPAAKTVMPLQPKALHDEMNSTAFDEFGRMQATLGVEVQPPTPVGQNAVLYPFINPTTEVIDGTNLPKENVVFDANGDPVSDVTITPLSDSSDGTQIWNIAHNGVDTHPIHFHLYDVQIVNRVTWDNIIIQTEANELGWKDTIRVSPLENTVVALRPIVPDVPWELPNAIRDLNPMMAEGSTLGFNNVLPDGTAPGGNVTNKLVNFGWEYVWHCHILSHEEMDMMRPQTLALPPNKPANLTFVNKGTGQGELTFDDTSIAETSFVVQRSDDGATWTDLALSPVLDSPLDVPNVTGSRTYIDTTYVSGNVYGYRVVAKNTVGYGDGFPQLTVQSVSDPITTGAAPSAPSALTAVIANSIDLTWTDNAANETGFAIERADNGGSWTPLTTLGPNTGADPTVTGTVTYADTTVSPGNSYAYRVRATNAAGSSPWSNSATVSIPALPAAPTGLTATPQAGPQGRLTWTDNATNETGFTVRRATDAGFSQNLVTTRLAGANITSYTDATVVTGATYYYQVRADNLGGSSAWSTPYATLVVPSIPAAPLSLVGTLQNPGGAGPQVALVWVSGSGGTETGFTLQRSDNGAPFATIATTAAGVTTSIDVPVVTGHTYVYRVNAFSPGGASAWTTSNTIVVPAVPAAPSGLTGSITRTAAGPDQVPLRWTDRSGNELGFTIQRATNSAFTTGVTSFAVGVNAIAYTDATVPHGATYYYRVRAYNLGGGSGWSNTVSFQTVPATPTGLAVTSVTRTSITLGWADVSSNETGYRIQRRPLGSSTWTLIATTAANATTYTNTGRSPNTSYEYRICGIIALGSSPWTLAVTATTLP